MVSCDRNLGRHAFVMGSSLPTTCACGGATLGEGGVLTVAPPPDLYDMVFWFVNGDKRQSFGARLYSLERRAKAALRLTAGGADKVEPVYRSIMDHVKGRAT